MADAEGEKGVHKPGLSCIEFLVFGISIQSWLSCSFSILHCHSQFVLLSVMAPMHSHLDQKLNGLKGMARYLYCSNSSTPSSLNAPLSILARNYRMQTSRLTYLALIVLFLMLSLTLCSPSRWRPTTLMTNEASSGSLSVGDLVILDPTKACACWMLLRRDGILTSYIDTFKKIRPPSCHGQSL